MVHRASAVRIGTIGSQSDAKVIPTSAIVSKLSPDGVELCLRGQHLFVGGDTPEVSSRLSAEPCEHSDSQHSETRIGDGLPFAIPLQQPVSAREIF
jgi:hypothetical protein